MSEARMLQIFVKRDTTFKQALDAFVDQYCSEIGASADKLIKGLMMKAEEIRKANPGIKKSLVEIAIARGPGRC
jgi:hypothetical protein